MKALKITGWILLGLFSVWLYLAAFGLGLYPPTPPLLKGASGEGGWWSGGCPAFDADGRLRPHAAPGREAISADLTRRLQHMAPGGSSASALEEALLKQGFRRLSPCEQDPSVHRAVFDQQGGGLLRLPIFSVVAWKTEGDTIVWVKGLLAVRGL